MAIKKDNQNVNAFVFLKKITTQLQRYIIFKLNELNFDEDIIDPDINIYKDNLMSAKTDYCGVCLEDKLTIILPRCSRHRSCEACYIKLYNIPCPYCRSFNEIHHQEVQE